MCKDCEAFRHEFAEAIIRKRLRLTEGEAHIVYSMWINGVWLSEVRERGDVLVSRLRAKLGNDKIATIRGRGYELTDAGKRQVEAALDLEKVAA